MKATLIRSLLFIASLVGACGACLGSTLYSSGFLSSQSNDPPESFFTINQNTGDASPFDMRGPGVGNLASDWRPDSFRVWGISDQRFLWRLNLLEGTASQVGGFSVPGITGIAFDITTGRLFAASRTNLYLADLTTNTGLVPLSLVGNTGGLGISALGFDGAGNLFGVDNSRAALIKIDTATGAAQTIAVNPVFINMTDVAARPEDGVMFGVTAKLQPGEDDSLYQINTTTGTATLIGPDFSLPQPYPDFYGVAFSPAVPEPSTLALAVLGLAAVSIHCCAAK